MLAAGLCACWLRPARAARTGFTTVEIAPGIHIRRGLDRDAAPDNDDAIANVGFIIGNECVAVMDTGGSLEDGERLRAQIRARTPLPIRYIILSHIHPDHIFGAGAFVQDAPAFVGHARLPEAIGRRGAYYQKGLEALLGPGRAGPIVTPTLLVQDHVALDLGGRVLSLTAHKPAHTDNDLSVLDHRTRTLLPADLLFVGRVPALDGSLVGWLSELGALKRVEADIAVPGHGPAKVPWPAAAADEERYLETLLRETRQAIKTGIEIEKAVTSVALSERDRWMLFDDYNGRNVTEAYKELEWE